MLLVLCELTFINSCVCLFVKTENVKKNLKRFFLFEILTVKIRKFLTILFQFKIKKIRFDHAEINIFTKTYHDVHNPFKFAKSADQSTIYYLNPRAKIFDTKHGNQILEIPGWGEYRNWI